MESFRLAVDAQVHDNAHGGRRRLLRRRPLRNYSRCFSGNHWQYAAGAQLRVRRKGRLRQLLCQARRDQLRRVLRNSVERTEGANIDVNWALSLPHAE